jgi:hypothetical protein
MVLALDKNKMSTSLLLSQNDNQAEHAYIQGSEIISPHIYIKDVAFARIFCTY